MDDFVVDYGYLCDLCRACEWKIALHRLDGRRMALRVLDGRDVLAGVKFTTEANLDAVAEVVFDVLRHRQLV